MAINFGEQFSPRELRARHAATFYRNSMEEKQWAASIDSWISEKYTARVVRDSTASLRGLNREAGQELVDTEARGDAVTDLLARIEDRSISFEDAKKERDQLLRADIRSGESYEAMVAAYESNVYSRDFPEDVIDNLFDAYPALNADRATFYI